MNSRHLRLWVAVIVFPLSLGLLLASAWPVPREQNTIALPVLVLPLSEGPAAPSDPSQQPAIPELWQIEIEQPQFIYVQEDDWVVLRLSNSPQTISPTDAAAVQDVYLTHNVVAVARLELPGLGAWRELLREPLRPGRPVTFRWALHAGEAGETRGVIWLSLEFVPLEGGEVQEMTLLSRPITLRAVTLLGLPVWLGRVIGAVGLAASLFLGVPAGLPALASGWNQKRKKALS